jgi:hypothetical protein
MCDLWWAKQHWTSISVSPAKHSTYCSKLNIILQHPGLVQQDSIGLYGLGSTPPQKEKKYSLNY